MGTPMRENVTPKHYHLCLDWGKPTQRIVSFATQAERLAAAKLALREERKCEKM